MSDTPHQRTGATVNAAVCDGSTASRSGPSRPEFYALVGADNRRDISELDPTLQSHRVALAAHSAVCMLIEAEHVELARDGSVVVQARAHPFDDRFAGQCSVAVWPYRSGFLVTPKYIVTALHNAGGAALSDLIALFGYLPSKLEQSGDGQSPVYRFPKDSWYRVACARLDDRRGWGRDIAVLCLERPCDRDRFHPLTLSSERPGSANAELAMIGCSRGLPLKATVAIDGHRATAPRVLCLDEARIGSTLDGTLGNSGSPVLDVESGHVVGVHHGGERDSHVDDPNRMNTLPEGSLGARATRVLPFLDVFRSIHAHIV